MAYTDFHTNRSESESVRTSGLRDPDGKIIDETEDGALLQTIVRLNDVATLKRYIETYPRNPLITAEVYHWDPYYIAALHGSTDALRVLLEYYEANPMLLNEDSTKSIPAKAPNERGSWLLDTACYGANFETACFLMDRQPPLGSIHDTNACGDTPLLSAAASLAEHNFSEWTNHHCTYDWYCDRLTRGEKLINLLLDRGASARDSWTNGIFRGDYDEQVTQSRDTVLSLAISRASYGLVKRLIDKGADLQRKEWYHRNHNGSLDAQDVTVLHIASSYWNVEGIKALLDHGGSNLVSSFDSEERLPIHWAAAGQGSQIDDIIPEDELQTQIVDTLKQLLTVNPGVINAQDKKGATPLHYAVVAHAGCGTGHSYPVIEFLCNNNADTSVVNAEGQTVLHVLAYHCCGGKPIDLALLDCLLKHGIDINHADSHGNTVLHIMSRVLLQSEAVRFLINKGANIKATNSKGDIPLHGVMRGSFLLPHTATRDEIISLTLEDRLKARDEMIAVLQEAPDYSSSLMEQANKDGKNPQQLFEEIRAQWRENDERLKRGFRRRNESIR